MFILLFVFLNLTNFYPRLLNCFGLGTFTFGTSLYSENKWNEGRKLIKNVRKLKEEEIEKKVSLNNI